MGKFHRVKPVGEQIVVLHDKNKRTTSGGILLSDRATIPVLTGRILAVSEKIKNNEFDYPFESGDHIVYDVNAAVPIDLDPGDKRYLLPAAAVLGVIQSSETPEDD